MLIFNREITFNNLYLAFSPEYLGPCKNRLADLGCDLARAQGDRTLLYSIFERLTHVDEVHGFTQRCPFPDHERALCAFWDRLSRREDSDPDPDSGQWYTPREFGHMYQSHMAIFLYMTLLEGTIVFKNPLKTLSLDVIPMEVFQGLGMSPYFVEHLQGSLRNIECLSIGIVIYNTILPTHQQKLLAFSNALTRFLGLMPKLESLTMIWYVLNHRGLQNSTIIRNW